MDDIDPRAISALLKAIKDHAREFSGQDASDVIFKLCGMPREQSQKILRILYNRGELGILMEAEEIVTIFPHSENPQDQKVRKRRARKKPKQRAVLIVDVENVRMGYKMSRDMFPGDIILGQLRSDPGFTLEHIFAITNDKARTMIEVDAQRRVLIEQGFMAVICSPVKQLGSDNVDETIARVASMFFHNSAIDTIIVVSADKDFKPLREDALNHGKQFLVHHAGGGINEEWEKESGAQLLNLSEFEERGLAYLGDCIAASKKKISTRPRADSPEQQLVSQLLTNTVMPTAYATREGAKSFEKLATVVWENIPSSYKQVISEQFVDRLLTRIIEETDLFTREGRYQQRKMLAMYKYREGCKFANLFPAAPRPPAHAQG